MLHQERANDGLTVLVKGDIYLKSVRSDFVHANEWLCSEPQSFESLALADGSISRSTKKKQKKQEKLLISVLIVLA